jgi:predicted glycoside hydrolase/deacetylase ChbG (UPF0249 family)
MTRLIVNADDLGWTPAITDGVLDAHAGGLLRSATWLANADGADDAVQRAPDSLDVGLHLALTGVRPLSDPAPFRPLLDADGRLPPRHGRVLRWLVTTPGAASAVEREWRAQYARFLDRWRRAPSHADSHQHVALAPPLHELFVRLAVEHGVGAARAPVEVRQPGDVGVGGLRANAEAVVLSVLGARIGRRARAAGLAVPDHFAGFRLSGRLGERALLGLVKTLRAGVTELMVHPGAQNGPGGYQRRVERDALLSPAVQAVLDETGVEVITFGDLAA